MSVKNTMSRVSYMFFPSIYLKPLDSNLLSYELQPMKALPRAIFRPSTVRWTPLRLQRLNGTLSW